MEDLIHQTAGALYNYLLRMVNQREDAEDLLQEVYLSFAPRFPKIPPGTRVSYLYRTAHNKAINYLKKRKRIVPLNESIVRSEKEDTSDSSRIQESKNRMIRQAIASLKPREASVINMQFYQGLRYQQIAEILDTSEKAVESLLVRAKKKLRKILSQDLKDPVVLKDENRKQESRVTEFRKGGTS